MTQTTIEVADELWERFKNVVPHSIPLRDKVSELVSEYVAKKEAENKNG